MTRAVIATVATSGCVIVGVAIAEMLRGPSLDPYRLAVFATVGMLIIATWVWPLVMYRDGQSEALNLDEGFFIILALLLPAFDGVLVFAIAIAIAQSVRRLQSAKFIFNWGQVVTAAFLAMVVTRSLAPVTPKLTVVGLVAAAVGAAVFSVVNSGAMAAILASLGTPWRGALVGMDIRLRLVGSCIAVATMSSLAISSYRWSLPVAVLPLLVLRQVLAGHFQARDDRTRLLGLFDAALEANRSLGEQDALGAILESARSLLRCPDAFVGAVPPKEGQLGATMIVSGEQSWLVVSGRSHTEPFDAADKVLLEALAAVGAGALTNGSHYREGRFQRERLAAITSSLGEGVCALDRSGRVTFANPAAARLLGWESSQDSFASPNTPAFLSEPAFEVMRTLETVRSDDTEFTRVDGTSLPVAFTASAILDDDRAAGAVIVFRDISERREAETAIRIARDQAIEASKLKSQFLANMSHEIRTPMNGVLGLSRLLLDTDIDDTQRKYLLALRDSGESLMVIINDVLDFSKIEAGKLDLEEVDFDLRSELASATNAMTVAALDKGLDFGLKLDPNLPNVVRSDPIRLRQILTNLVGNAIKFTHAGSVIVSADVLAGGQVRISVTDTGIGIDPGARATVLEAFGQADSSTTRRYGGTGLGLAICSQLVAMMGGVLDFVSRPGEGSSFWFEVPFSEPLATGVAEPAPVTECEPAPAAGSGSAPDAVVTAAEVVLSMSTPRGRVLIADDAPVNLLIGSLVVQGLGYQVDVVTTGEEALRAVQNTRYDAVLMDCLMPVMDGYEATRRIRQLDGPVGETPIIAMTALAMVGDREGCIRAGMDDYLSKPLDPHLLAAALEASIAA